MIIFADLLCKRRYKLQGGYSYLPPKLSGTLTAFDTIGSGVSRYSLSHYLNKVRTRISNSDYLSVRDSRVVKSIDSFSSPDLFPDSAITMADFITDDFLVEECSDQINQLKNKDYICFQAAPNKTDASAIEWVDILNKISERYSLEVILCPIGYASGHDDFDFLEEIHKKSLGKFTLLYELNLWEIMSIIKNSKIFLGTSLHGVITALSFSVSYIGLNPKVTKLDAFLKNWGINPSNRCYSADEILDVIVEHDLYGELVGGLYISNEIEMLNFMQKYEKSQARLLSQLTNGIHLHTIRYQKAEDLAQIKQALAEQGILYQDTMDATVNK